VTAGESKLLFFVLTSCSRLV